MNETQRRIKAYKAALPALRERVIAVALLLAMSTSMLATASFAWLTISANPEVTGMATTVAANGNLEVALVKRDGSVPEESDIGDSSATKGQSIAAANLTWGNLINLSDESYGLENLTLRPATLNKAALKTSPLYAADYYSDGRIKELSSNFFYTMWKPAEGNTPAQFGYSEEFGVRAISSVVYDGTGFYADYLQMRGQVDSANTQAGLLYESLGSNTAYMGTLATLMGTHMTATLNSEDEYKNATVSQEDLENMIGMYELFLDAFAAEAEALADLLNLQLFLKHNGDISQYTEYSAAQIRTITQGELTQKGLRITDIAIFQKQYTQLEMDLQKLLDIKASGNTKWTESGLTTLVNSLVNVNKCTVAKGSEAPVEIGSLGVTAAAGYLTGTATVTITNGVLYEFERRTGASLQIQGMKIKVTAKRSSIAVPATITGNVSTNAPTPSLFQEDLTYTGTLFGGGDTADKSKYRAQDTYGLAIDLWVRTNEADSYLMLEGNVLTETETVRVTGYDNTGAEVELWTATITQPAEEEGGEATSFDLDLYQKEGTDESGNTVTIWYSASTHSEITEEDLNGAVPIAKMQEIEHVLGFEGENRVWGDNTLMSTDATTQGSGSCYVYYADTPEDQARSLRLLEAFKVAFVDGEGKLLAIANMDTNRHYVESGRVVVPLVLDASQSIAYPMDTSGETRAIKHLKQNESTWITALVYLEGPNLTNDDVLAAADIQGQLNIQFGSSAALDPIENETLQTDIRTVSASADQTSFDYDTHVGDMTTNVALNIAGSEPTTVTAFFIRQVNSTQGSREGVMTFHKNDSGQWVSNYTFTVPGTYVLRNVQLDGIECHISGGYPTVEITGFALKSLSCAQAGSGKNISVMTAAATANVDLSLEFATDDVNKMPKEVAGRFISDDGAVVSVNFVLNPTTRQWHGSGTFLKSGDYRLQYLVLDGEYLELSESMQYTANVVLGMRAAVYTTSPTSFKFDYPKLMDNQKNLYMQVKIMDNSGNEMMGLSNAKLTYSGGGLAELDTDLTWNAVSGYYEGILNPRSAGNFTFSHVTVGSNTITYATTAPAFALTPAKPPEFYTFEEDPYIFAPDNDAKMRIQLKNAATAVVVADFVDDRGVRYENVQASTGDTYTLNEEDTVTTFVFTVPDCTARGTQDGTWTMEEVRIIGGAYDVAGNPYTEEDPLVIDMRDKGFTTKVVFDIDITFPEGQSIDFGKDASGKVTGLFMDSHNITSLKVNITDFEGEPLNASNVRLTYDYKGDAKDKGSYTGANTIAKTGVFAMDLTADSTGTSYTWSGAQAVQLAGTYQPTFSFTVGTKTYKYSATDNANTPTFTVWSKTPAVKVVAVDPDPSQKFMVARMASGTAEPVENVSNYISDDQSYAVVYISGTRSAGNWTHSVPSVTLRLENVAAGEASLTITNAADTNTKHVFNFTAASPEAKTTVGRAESGFGSGTKYNAGKAEFTEIDITYNNATYNVQFETPLVIEQPDAPMVLQFEGVPANVPETDRPDTIISNTSRVGVYLPKITWTEDTVANGAPVWDNAGWTRNRTVRTDYSTNNINLGLISRVRYQYFAWTEYIRHGTETGVATRHYKEISSWIINNKTYRAGATYEIELSDNTVATAIVTEVRSQSLGSTTVPISEFRYGYVEGDDDQRNPPSGGKHIKEAWGSYPKPGLYDSSVTSDINGYEQFWP